MYDRNYFSQFWMLNVQDKSVADLDSSEDPLPGS